MYDLAKASALTFKKIETRRVGKDSVAIAAKMVFRPNYMQETFNPTCEHINTLGTELYLIFMKFRRQIT